MLASSSRNALKRAHSTITIEAHAAVVRLHDGLQHRHAHAVPQARTEPFVSGDSPVRPGGQRGGGLRHAPYAFQPDAGFRAAPLTRVARYNLELGGLAERGRIWKLFQLCKKMKEERVMPDLTTYSYILHVCADEGRSAEARAAFEDMLALGLYPNRNLFHHLLHAVRHQDSSEMWDVLENMQQFDIAPNETTYEMIIARFANAGHVELALQFLGELGERGLSPTLKTAQGIILAAARLGFPRLALDLADAFEETSVRRLDSEVWVACLVSCSEALYNDGVLRAWQKVVHELRITPDEGCCIQVLHTAARHGHSALGLDVLRILGRIGAAWKEYHFAPIIEAFCRENKIKEALGTLELIRSHDINPVAETAYPIFQAIQNDPDTVDEAWGHLQSLHEEGKQIDVTALNVIIQASVALGDLQRAVGTYKACATLGVKPNVDTYNLLIAGCIAATHRELGDRLLVEMKQAGIKPDARTYERLLMLCLTQSTYEDAFFYLEEMKSEGHVPPLTVYEAIIRKCVSVGDTRYKLAVEELVECGYEVSSNLDAFINSGGEHDSAKKEPMYPRPPSLLNKKSPAAWLRDKKLKKAQEGMRELDKGVRGMRTETTL